MDYRIGYKLDEILIERKIKKKDFEERIGVPRNYISKIIWHEVNISLELFLRIIKELEITPEELLCQQ